MTFEQTIVADCPKCGNKVRPKYIIEQDMSAHLRCPDITCGYCETSAGVFYPDQEALCLTAWKKKVKLKY